VFNVWPVPPNLSPALLRVLTVLWVRLKPPLVVPCVTHALLVRTRTPLVSPPVCPALPVQLKPPTDSPPVWTVWRVDSLEWEDSLHARTAPPVPPLQSTRQQAALHVPPEAWPQPQECHPVTFVILVQFSLPLARSPVKLALPVAMCLDRGN
jgi:hypothetical protein